MHRSVAGEAVGQLSVGFGALALAAPTATARALGVDPLGNPALPLLVRLIGIRNTTMGLGLLTAASAVDRQRALQFGIAVGVSDLIATVLASRSRLLDARASVTAVAILGGIAALGGTALRQERQLPV